MLGRRMTDDARQQNPEPGPSAGLRLALVSGSVPLGGTTNFLCNLAGDLVRRGDPVRIWSFVNNLESVPEFERLGIPLSLQDARTTIFEDRARAILEDLRRFQPTAVVANLDACSFEILRYVPAGVLRVGTVQSDAEANYELARRYTDHVDIMVAVSRFIEQRLSGLAEFRNKPVCYQPYGVPIPPVRRREWPGKSVPLRILYLGRLEQPQKRVRLFPQILQALRAAAVPFDWTIAGTGPEEAFLRGALRSSRPDQRISFTGHVAYADVPALLLRHDVYLLASDHEGLPLSLLEAMGAGLVPVVSDLPSGIPEVVDASVGILVPPDRVAGYAEGIVRLHHHREVLRHMSEGAQARVRREFSVAAMADRWLGMLRRASLRPPKDWPERIAIRPILGAIHPLQFSPPARWVRRRLKRW
jgi:glycosyltransferase involved in cell wall biosynthesis